MGCWELEAESVNWVDGSWKLEAESVNWGAGSFDVGDEGWEWIFCGYKKSLGSAKAFLGSILWFGYFSVVSIFFFLYD